jgi:hypothetical protein
MKKILIGNPSYMIYIGKQMEKLNNTYLYEKNKLSTKDKIEKMRSYRK